MVTYSQPRTRPPAGFLRLTLSGHHHAGRPAYDLSGEGVISVSDAKSPHGGPVLPGLRLDELLGGLQARLADVVHTRDRVRAPLEAVVAVGANLELEIVLR